MFRIQTFAIRFASTEIAQEFKTAFTKGQDEMKVLMSGEDADTGKKEADEATEALESLNVKEEPKKEDA